MRKLLCLVLFVLTLIALPLEAAVAPNVTTDTGANNGSATNTASWSFDAVGGGCATCALLVQIEGDTTTDDMVGVTYNGIALTFLNKAHGGGIGRWTYTYGLLNPASGSNTTLATASITHYLFGVAVSYSGVTGFGATSSNGSGGVGVTQLTGNITTTQTNSWVYAGCASSNLGAWTGITNATLRLYYVPFSSPAIFDNNTAIAVGAYSMTIDTGFTGDIGMVMVELLPGAGGGGSGVKTLLLLGVGGHE